MRKRTAALGSALFFLLAPGVFAGVVPWLLTRWGLRPAFLGLEATRWVGVALIVIGVAGLVDSFARFALQGLGTPAPIAPPQKLVVTGLYRYVRNPMYVAFLGVIFGQAFLFADTRLLAYGALVWLAAHLYVVFYEEWRLKRNFGIQYTLYKNAVPRWIPRLAPWSGA